MVRLLVKGIRRKKVGGVRVDVVDEDELMACSREEEGPKVWKIGKSGFMGKWRSL